MNLATVLSQNRRKEAIARTDYSRPIRIASIDGLIDPTTTVFDYRQSPESMAFPGWRVEEIHRALMSRG